MTTHSKHRWYVGINGSLRVGIRIRNSTFAQAYAEKYAALVGPFRTKRAAVWFVEHPQTTLQTVAEIEAAVNAERLAKSSDRRTKEGRHA